MADFNADNLRFIGSGETDYDSPNSELLNTGYRQNLEALILRWFGTGVTGTATSNPSNDTNGYFYDTAAGFSDDEHNGRTLLMTSGTAKGFFYTIDDTVASSDRLACTGDNLYSDGVRSGDSYAIVYDLMVNTSGHNHDNVNSPSPVLASNSVGTGPLKTGTNSTSGSQVGATTTNIAMADYCFSPNIYCASSANQSVRGYTSSSAVYNGRFSIVNGTGTYAYAVYWRYVTASDQPFVMLLRDKLTGEIRHAWMGEDPPDRKDWGRDAEPADFVSPIIDLDQDGNEIEYDRETYWKYPMAGFWELLNRAKKDNKLIHEAFADYDYDRKSKLFKPKNLTMI